MNKITNKQHIINALNEEGYGHRKLAFLMLVFICGCLNRLTIAYTSLIIALIKGVERHASIAIRNIARWL